MIIPEYFNLNLIFSGLCISQVPLPPGPEQSEPGKGNQAIKEQKGIAQVKIKEVNCEEIEQIGHQGR